MDAVLRVGTRGRLEAAGEDQAFVRWIVGPLEGFVVLTDPFFIGAGSVSFQILAVLHPIATWSL